MNVNPKYKCPNCGTLVYEKEKYCRECGSRLKRYYKKKTKVIFVIVIIVVTAFAGKVFYDIRKYDRLQELADQSYIEIEHPDIPNKDIMALDPDAFWKDESNIEMIADGLSDRDVTVLNQVINSLNYYTNYQSKQEMITSLNYSNISTVRAEKMIDLCQVDFKMQALKRSLYLMNVYSFSPYSLKEELISYEFTPEEAEYAVENCNADWKLQTKLAVQSYLNHFGISEKKLYKQIKHEKFDMDVAKKYVEELHPDWNIECLQAALDHRSINTKDLDKALARDGFTPEQIEYVMELIE